MNPDAATPAGPPAEPGGDYYNPPRDLDFGPPPNQPPRDDAPPGRAGEVKNG